MFPTSHHRKDLPRRPSPPPPPPPSLSPSPSIIHHSPPIRIPRWRISLPLAHPFEKKKRIPISPHYRVWVSGVGISTNQEQRRNVDGWMVSREKIKCYATTTTTHCGEKFPCVWGFTPENVICYTVSGCQVGLQAPDIHFSGLSFPGGFLLTLKTGVLRYKLRIGVNQRCHSGVYVRNLRRHPGKA